MEMILQSVGRELELSIAVASLVPVDVVRIKRRMVIYLFICLFL